ncbi:MULTISPECIES: hypothetical protein [unclassified Microcoleus]
MSSAAFLTAAFLGQQRFWQQRFSQRFLMTVKASLFATEGGGTED